MLAFVFAVVVLGLLSSVRVRRRLREMRASAASGGTVRTEQVQVDGTGIGVVRAGDTRRVAWNDVLSVHIESVAGGLNADNVRWVLTPARGAPPLSIAQTAPGADAMIARLQQLPGFRYEPMINSMITTEATRWLVWERADA